MVTGKMAREATEEAFLMFALGVACTDAPRYTEKQLKALFLASSAIAWGMSVEDIAEAVQVYRTVTANVQENNNG